MKPVIEHFILEQYIYSPPPQNVEGQKGHLKDPII